MSYKRERNCKNIIFLPIIQLGKYKFSKLYNSNACLNLTKKELNQMSQIEKTEKIAENFYTDRSRFKWNVKLRFLSTELIGALAGAGFAALLMAFFSGFNEEQGRAILIDHAWWIISFATALALPINEILFFPIHRFLKFFKKNKFSEKALNKAYVRAHNIPILHGIFMFSRFSIASILTGYTAARLLPPPVSAYQVAFCILIPIFAGFISGCIAYLSAERVFRSFIDNLNLSVWKIPRKLIRDKKIIKIPIRTRMIMLLVPLFVLTFIIIGLFVYIQIKTIIEAGPGGTSDEMIQGILYKLIFVLVSSTFFSIFVIVFSATNTVKPLMYAIETMRHVSNGDLTKRLIIDSQDEVRNVLYEIISTIKNLENILMRFREYISRTKDLSRFLNVISQSVGEGASIQREAMENSVGNIMELAISAEVVKQSVKDTTSYIEEVFNALESFVESIDGIVEMVSGVREDGDLLSKKVQEGEKKLELMVADMQRIQESSARINEATTNISEISDQTNLLALNASIEASRAGEHGAGFGVVADEVSKLAERSAIEVRRIEDLVKQTANDITKGVESVNEIKSLLTYFIYNVYHIVSKIDKISEETKKQSEGSDKIKSFITNLSEMSQNILIQTNEQAENTVKMENSIRETEVLTKDYSRNSMELNNLCDTLDGLASELTTLISMFKLIEK